MSRDVCASGEPPAGGELPIDAQPSLDHAQQLKEQLATAFRHHPAGAAIITVNGANGPEGLTASSLISVAVEPAIIVFSAGRTTSTSRQLTRGGRVIVHMLNADAEELANVFACPGADHYAGVRWQMSSERAPELDVSGPHLHGWVRDAMDVGPSAVWAVQIDRIDLGDRDSDALVYLERRWRHLRR